MKTAYYRAEERLAPGLRIAVLSCVSRSPLGSSAVQTLDARRNLVNPSDELFFALEGRTIESRGDRWRIEVCGVHSADAHHWVQLNLSGPVQCGLTLRTERLEALRVTEMVCDWLNDSVPSDLESSLVGKLYAPALNR
jgi:hypothetical protein